MTSSFTSPTFTLKRTFWKFFGAEFHIFDQTNTEILYGEMKAFKLREDIRLYHDKTKTEEVLRIHARQIIDLNAVYDVFDSKTNQKIGAFRRKGIKAALFKDEWLILDVQDQEVGSFIEDSTALALVRRLITNLIPQSFTITYRDQTVGQFKHRFNPFLITIDADFSRDTQQQFDRRLGLVALVLLAGIEGKQWTGWVSAQIGKCTSG